LRFVAECRVEGSLRLCYQIARPISRQNPRWGEWPGESVMRAFFHNLLSLRDTDTAVAVSVLPDVP
jgi:hypothetical protein